MTKPAHKSETVGASLQARQDYSRHDAHAKMKLHLLLTQPIWIQATNGHRWSQGVVKSKAGAPQSYVVKTPQDEWRRNRLQLKDAAISTTVPVSTKIASPTSSTTVQPTSVFLYTKDVPIKL